MDVRIEKLPSTRVAFVRHTGPYTQCGVAWQRLFAFAGPAGLLGPTMNMFGLCHDDPEVIPAERLRYDACLAISLQFQASGDIGVQETPGGEYAVATHRGPYEKLSETYGAIMGRWMPANHREPGAGPCIEFYRNNPVDTRPEDLVTDVCVPLNSGSAGPS